MPLIPVTPTISAVSKLATDEPDAAAELVRIGLYEAFNDLADMYGPRMRRLFKRAEEERINKAHRLRQELVRQYVSKRRVGEPIDGILAAAEEIAKADPSGGRWDPRDHPRDEFGRWSKKLNADSVDEGHRKADALADHLLRTGAVKPGTDVLVHGVLDTDEPGEEPEPYTMNAKVGDRGEGLKYPEGSLDPTFRPEEVSGHESDLQAKPPPPPPPPSRREVARQGALDIGQSFIGYNPQTGANEQQFGTNLKNIAEPSGTSGRGEGDRRAYRQLAVAGGAVRTLSGGSQPAATVGTLAQVAGELGPQAERVLGPGIRRTAYRYRGTEREPNAQLVREVGDATLASAVAGQGTPITADGSLAGGTGAYYSRGSGPTRLGGPSQASRAQRMAPDELDLRLRGDTAVGYFVNKIPDPDRTALSIAAGRVPPSQGTIIDRNGNVATEAMGAGSDHYLPFDLKNLKALQGGQYVRTRAAGGPTTEDIYTGLVGGARQVQVASNSGVFTVEFDPSLRGSRRYSDKARQMIGRYQDLLGRIHESQQGKPGKGIYVQDIDPHEKARIVAGAYARAGYNRRLGEEYANDALEEARQQQMFDAPTDEELEHSARQQVLASPHARSLSRPQLETAIQDQFHQNLKEIQSQRVDRLKLDGEGYYKALQSLREEFPYFIRNVDYQDLRAFSEDRSHREQGQAPLKGEPRATDTGFVPRGSVTATDRKRGTEEPKDESGSAPSTPKGPTDSGSGGASATSTIKAKPFKPTSSLGNEADLKTDLLSSFGDTGPIFELHSEPTEGVEPNMDRLLNGGHPIAWLSAYQEKAGSWNKVADQLATSGTPAELRKTIQALDQIIADDDRDARSGVSASIEPDQRAKIDQTKKVLTRLIATKQKPTKVEGDRALYTPSGEDPPAHFDELDFDQTPENLEGWRGAQQGYKQYEQAESELAGKNRQQRTAHLTQKVGEYQRLQRWAAAKEGVQDPGNPLARTQTQAQQIIGAKHNAPEYQHLEHLQLAHTYLTQREGASALAGGDAGPKAPEGGTPWSPPAAREREPFAHRHPRADHRRVVVHPPGSPIAKALERQRRTW